jgi:hypothetical protein
MAIRMQTEAWIMEEVDYDALIHEAGIRRELIL